MFCVHCGQALPTDASFCSNCGEAVREQDRPAGTAAPAGGDVETTTAAIDLSSLEDDLEIENLPDLAPGTGMFIVVRGPNAGARFLLDRETTTIGRHPDSDIFLDDVTVSRRHTEIVRTDAGLELRDLGSLNGTYVNGERVETKVLVTGDQAQVGRFKLVFVGVAPAPPA